ncbi:extracellular matrix protein 1-like [Acanthochromis polyacanthus]|nr:extracellular matrix protein 1-like [Acanthochromis polyacanthus]
MQNCSTLHNESKKNSLSEPNVPFPPARPTAHNLAAVCHQGQGRPRYPDSFFPPSFFSHFRRRGKAINRLELWFTLCCSGLVAQQSSQILCCTQQAWKQALSQFCVDEYSTMTVPYVCCEASGDARWSCFNSKPENPNYNPTLGYTAPPMNWEPGFTFNPQAC